MEEISTRKLPDRETILKFLIYDAEKGILINKISMKDSRHPKGYKISSINKSKFGDHRIIYFLETGKQPTHIDHIDGNILNNHISNLREITNRNNIRKSSVRTGGTSKYKGVFRDNKSSQWQAAITIDFKSKYLIKSYDEKECARAYDQAAIYYFGEFVNLNKFYFPEIIPLETSLIIFSSTKGHFGVKDYFKYTISSLNENFDLKVFKERVIHIKRENGDEETFEEMVAFSKRYGFKILTSFGEWSHNDPNNSHAKEYYKDMIKVFNHNLLSDSKYFFIFEDDYILQKSIEKSWQEIFLEAKELLDKKPEILCVRFNKNTDTKKGEPISENIFIQPIDYTRWGPTYTFQPTIVKASKIKAAWDLIETNFEVLDREHCELVSGNALKNFSRSQTPFAFFNPEVASSIHIGEEDKKKIINDNNLQIKDCEINWENFSKKPLEWIEKDFI